MMAPSYKVECLRCWPDNESEVNLEVVCPHCYQLVSKIRIW